MYIPRLDQSEEIDEDKIDLLCIQTISGMDDEVSTNDNLKERNILSHKRF
jgi:hypothetical protein